MKKTLVTALALLAIFAGVWLLLKQWRGPRIVLNSYEALGEVAAEETARLLNQNGRVVIISYDAKKPPNPPRAAQLSAFQKSLKKVGGITIASTETFTLTPMEQMATGGAFPREQFLRVLESHPNLDAIVLFVGFPALAAPELDRLKKSGAKIVLISGYRPAYKDLLTARLIHLAIVPRSGSPPGNPPKSSREWFDQDYVILTPDRLSDAPY